MWEAGLPGAPESPAEALGGSCSCLRLSRIFRDKGSLGGKMRPS